MEGNQDLGFLQRVSTLVPICQHDNASMVEYRMVLV